MNLSDSTLADLCDHAAAAYPRECCGMIHRSGRVRRCRNIASRPDRFEFAADDVVALFESQATADPVTVIYHSHPDAKADWSAGDEAGARALGASLLTRLTWFVVTCPAGRPTRIVSYKWHSATEAHPTVPPATAAGGQFLRLAEKVFHRREDRVVDLIGPTAASSSHRAHNYLK